jgi:hypothetical protein
MASGGFPSRSTKEQWTKLRDLADEIRVFILEHDAELKTKEPKTRHAETL